MSQLLTFPGARPGSDASLFVDDVYDAIVALPKPEREAALAARCEGHPSVEAEVRALLDATSLTHDEVTTSRPVSSLQVGTVLGRYRLDEQLGAGATASVWKAFDEQLRTWTALKLLHPHVHARRALDAVMTEARAASRIISDHVVRIKSAGRFGDLHYIDMALCAEHRPDPSGEEVLEIGRTLADTPLRSVDEVVRVVGEAARGVDAAHRVGVLHRDLKPANILLLPVSRRALVTDFGLAAPHLFPAPGPDTPGTATVTMVGAPGQEKLVGTPCYMPPEQAWGHPPLRASDVYGLGATLYALLTGQAPYQPKGLPPRPALETVLRVREEPPADVREVEPRVPERLARIVRKAMARSPRQRYATAAALAADLEAFRAGQPASVDADRPLVRAGLWLRRHRAEVITASVLGSLLIAMLAGAMWMSHERRMLTEAVALAEAQRLKATMQADVASTLERQAQVRRAEAEEASREAQRRAELAQQAREAALRSESDAEQRAALERAAREAAVAAQVEAMALVEATEASRAAAEAARAAVEASLADALADGERSQEALAAAITARRDAEEALRRAHVEIAELQLATEAAQRRADELEAALREVRDDLLGLRTQLRSLATDDEAPPSD